jgi:hypothetical protein
MGDGSNFDLQYVPGSRNAWSSNNGLHYWLNKYAPGPATINGIAGSSSNDVPAGPQAHIGDRLYDVLNTEGNGIDIIAYMQVLEVTTENVVVDMWLWNAS